MNWVTLSTVPVKGLISCGTYVWRGLKIAISIMKTAASPVTQSYELPRLREIYNRGITYKTKKVLRRTIIRKKTTLWITFVGDNSHELATGDISVDFHALAVTSNSKEKNTTLRNYEKFGRTI
jgi:hypothetical protein